MNGVPPVPPAAGSLDVGRAMTDRLVMHQNVQQEVVVITVDKLRICLEKQRGYLASSREWLGFAGLTLSLIATLVTSSFQTSLGLKPEHWQAIYVISAFLSLGWTLKLIVEAVRANRLLGIDGLIDRIKNQDRQALSPIASAILDAVRHQLEPDKAEK